MNCGVLTREDLEKDICQYQGGTVGVMYVNENKINDESLRCRFELDSLLTSAFPDYNVYDLGCNEYLVMAIDIKLSSFLQRVLAWHRWLWTSLDYPIASVGYSVEAEVMDIKELILIAQDAVLVDKKIFSKRYPDLQI